MYYHRVGNVLYVLLGVTVEDEVSSQQRVAVCIPDASRAKLLYVAHQTTYDFTVIESVSVPTEDEAGNGLYRFQVHFVPGTEINDVLDRVANGVLSNWVRQGLPIEGVLERV